MLRPPNFIVLGAAKSGTSSLHHYLSQHPDICMSLVKEPNFFAMLEEKPNLSLIPGNASRDLREESKRRFKEAEARSIKTLEAYSALFESCSPDAITGEISPFYLYNPSTAARIYQHAPDVKLIVILRNPVDRAYSHYLHFRRDGLESVKAMSAAILAEDIGVPDIWWGYRHYVRAGFYYEQLKHYFDLFPAEHIKPIIYDDLCNEPLETIRQMLEFIGADPDFTPNIAAKHNVSGIPRSRVVNLLLSPRSPVKSILSPLLSPRLKKKLTESHLFSTLRRKNLRHQPLDKDTRDVLTDIYIADITRLQHLLDRDLSHWLL